MRVADASMMYCRKPGNVCAPADPGSKTVVEPLRRVHDPPAANQNVRDLTFFLPSGRYRTSARRGEAVGHTHRDAGDGGEEFPSWQCVRVTVTVCVRVRVRVLVTVSVGVGVGVLVTHDIHSSAHGALCAEHSSRSGSDAHPASVSR